MSEKDQVEIVPDIDDLQPLDEIDPIEKLEPAQESQGKPANGNESNDEGKVEDKLDAEIEDTEMETKTGDHGNAAEEAMEVNNPISADIPSDIMPESGNKMDEESHTV